MTSPSGEWEEDHGKLVGKEFIIIPQAMGKSKPCKWNGTEGYTPAPCRRLKKLTGMCNTK